MTVVEGGRQAPSVVLVSKALGPPWNNGSSKLVSELVGGFADLDLQRAPQLSVFGKAGYGRSEPNVEVVTLTSAERSRNTDYFIYLLRHGGSDLYHFFFAPHPVAVAGAYAVSIAARKPMLQTVCSQPKSFRNARRLCFGEKVVALSTWTKDRLVAGGVSSSRIEVIHPPLRPPSFPHPERLHAARAHLRLSVSSRPIIFPGDAEPGGGLQTFVRSAPDIARRHQDIVFIIACRAKTTIAARELARARAIVESLGMVESVRFVGELDDFQAALAVSELCVLPASSLYAKVDFPYALLEAMALGTPIVVAHGTPLEELVTLCGGLLVPRRAPRVLAGAINALLDDRPRLDTLRIKADEAMRALFNPEKIARQYLSVFREVA